MPTKKKTPKRSSKTTKQPIGFMQKLQTRFGKNLYPALALLIGLIIGASGYYIYQQNYSGAGGKKTVTLLIYSANGRYEKVGLLNREFKESANPCASKFPSTPTKKSADGKLKPLKITCKANTAIQVEYYKDKKDKQPKLFYDFNIDKSNKCYLLHDYGYTRTLERDGKNCVKSENESDITERRATALTIKTNKKSIRPGSSVTYSGILSSPEEPLNAAECKAAVGKLTLNAKVEGEGGKPVSGTALLPKISYKNKVCTYKVKQGYGKSSAGAGTISHSVSFSGTDNLAPSVSPTLTQKVDKK